MQREIDGLVVAKEGFVSVAARRHEFITFSVDNSGLQMIRNFSLRQRLHLLLELLYGEGPDMLVEFGGVSVLSVAE